MKMLNESQVIRKLHSSILEKIAIKYELTVNELMIIMFLNEHYDQDLATDIVNKLMISKAHVSGLVNNLEKAGYIVRNKDNKDKKKIHIEVTEKAQPILKEIRKERRKMHETIYNGISKEERKFMKTILKKIYTNIQNNYGLN